MSMIWVFSDRILSVFMGFSWGVIFFVIVAVDHRNWAIQNDRGTCHCFDRWSNDNTKRKSPFFFSRRLSFYLSLPLPLSFFPRNLVETFYLFNWTKNVSLFVYLPNYLLFWLTPARSNFAHQSHKNESLASI